MKDKIAYFLLLIVVLTAVILPVPAKAQITELQNVSLLITGFIDLTVPTTLNLPQSFENTTLDSTIYQPFSPTEVTETVLINDTRNLGGFDLFLNIDNFLKNTVASDPTSPLGNLPGDIAIEVTDSDEYAINQTILFDNGEQATITDITSSTEIEVDRAINGTTINAHAAGSGIGLIIPYHNVSVITLATAAQPPTVDATATSNPASVDVTTVVAPLDCDWDFVSDFATFCEAALPGFTTNSFTGTGTASNPQTIIDGDPPTLFGRVGTYALALGLRVIIPFGTIPGNYQSIFTFTLIPT